MTDHVFDQQYRNDPVFRSLADTMYEGMKNGTFTPTDVRQALFVASCRLENERTEPAFLRSGK